MESENKNEHTNALPSGGADRQQQPHVAVAIIVGVIIFLVKQHATTPIPLFLYYRTKGVRNISF